ncbi:TPA: hypothetical protein HA251_05545 [Candidatus Woesearchaeota archaeon]|nr:hypothetical protein [Candidatus Woesearchaeota archaeon]
MVAPTRFSVLLSDADRQVQIADHLLTVTYPMVKDPKLLMSVIEHCRRAIEDCADAVVEFHVSRDEYELPLHTTAGQPVGKHNALAAFSDLVKIRHPNIPAAGDAVALCKDFMLTLQQYKEAPVSFPRDERLVIASEGFAFLKEVTPAELKRSLHEVKRFVHGAHQHILLSQEHPRLKNGLHEGHGSVHGHEQSREHGHGKGA